MFDFTTPIKNISDRMNRKPKPNQFCVDCFSFKVTHQLKPKHKMMLSQENHKQRKWKGDILTTGKTKSRHVMRDQVSHNIMLKGLIHQDHKNCKYLWKEH